jgi:hypothetical protein
MRVTTEILATRKTERYCEEGSISATRADRSKDLTYLSNQKANRSHKSLTTPDVLNNTDASTGQPQRSETSKRKIQSRFSVFTTPSQAEGDISTETHSRNQSLMDLNSEQIYLRNR